MKKISVILLQGTIRNSFIILEIQHFNSKAISFFRGHHLNTYL
jgi:hypothetical protein